MDPPGPRRTHAGTRLLYELARLLEAWRLAVMQLADSVRVGLSDDMIAGGFAGLVARMLTAPFDVLKIRYQLNKNNIAASRTMWHAMRNIAHDEGISALWKGNVPALYLWVTYAVVQFALYNAAKKIVHAETTIDREGHEHKASSTRRAIGVFFAGAIASTVATTLTYPFDIARTQLALQGQQRVHTMASFAIAAVRTRGLNGLYSGIGPAVLSVTPYMGLNFAIYETLKNAFPDGHYNETHGWARNLKKGLLGGVAGGASKLVVYPLDTVKKRLQAHTLHSLRPFGDSLQSCARTIYATEGIHGFYRGLVPTSAKSVIATAITFGAFEAAKDLLQERHQREE